MISGPDNISGPQKNFSDTSPQFLTVVRKYYSVFIGYNNFLSSDPEQSGENAKEPTSNGRRGKKPSSVHGLSLDSLSPLFPSLNAVRSGGSLFPTDTIRRSHAQVLFASLDTDGSGVLSVSEFAFICSALQNQFWVARRDSWVMTVFEGRGWR